MTMTGPHRHRWAATYHCSVCHRVGDPEDFVRLYQRYQDSIEDRHRLESEVEAFRTVGHTVAELLGRVLAQLDADWHVNPPTCDCELGMEHPPIIDEVRSLVATSVKEAEEPPCGCVCHDPGADPYCDICLCPEPLSDDELTGRIAFSTFPPSRQGESNKTGNIAGETAG